MAIQQSRFITKDLILFIYYVFGLWEEKDRACFHRSGLSWKIAINIPVNAGWGLTIKKKC